MALRFNGNSPTGPNPWSAAVGRTIGTVGGINAYTGARALSAQGGSRMAIHLTYGTNVGLPAGSTHPVSWAMPSVAGVIASRNNINGSGGITGSMQSGQNLEATLTGDGGVSNGLLGLIVSIAAALSGSGGVSSAATQALATLTAVLAGTGNISATAAGLAALTATLTGSGSVSPNNTALMDITANIVGYGEVTSEGVRDAVWSRIIEAGFSAEQIMRLLASQAAGDATGLEGATPAFKSLDGTKTRIAGTYSAGTRNVTTVDGS